MPLANGRFLLLALKGGEAAQVGPAAGSLEVATVTVESAEGFDRHPSARTAAVVVIGRKFLEENGKTAFVSRLREASVKGGPAILAIGDWDDDTSQTLLTAGVDVILPEETGTGLVAAQLRRLLLRGGRFAELGTILERQGRELAEVQERFREHTESTLMAVHDLKSPIAAVMGLLEHVLASAELSDENREALELARSEAGYISLLAADMIELRRLEESGYVIQPMPVADITALVDEALLDAGARSTGCSVAVEVRVAGVPEVDARLVRRVLANLISNAFKFTHSAGNVGISVLRKGERLQFSVADDGRGMTPAQVENLGRADILSHDSGIGLAFCQTAVKRLGGSFEVVTAPGQGTKVSFTLPVTWQVVKA